MNPVLLQGWIAFFETLDAVLTGRLAAVATDFFYKKICLLRNCFSDTKDDRGGLPPEKIPAQGNNSIFYPL
jgi:hypothetical protein